MDVVVDQNPQPHKALLGTMRSAFTTETDVVGDSSSCSSGTAAESSSAYAVWTAANGEATGLPTRRNRRTTQGRTAGFGSAGIPRNA